MTDFRVLKIVAAVIAIAFAAAVFFKFASLEKDQLVLVDSESRKIYASFEVEDGSEFAVEFIHSVNKSPVRDVFVIKEGKIVADRTIYSAFGAGVQTEVEDGQRLEYDKDGNMVVSGFDIVFPRVKYIVGTVSDHILYIQDEAVSLTELCGRNSHIYFELR